MIIMNFNVNVINLQIYALNNYIIEIPIYMTDLTIYKPINRIYYMNPYNNILHLYYNYKTHTHITLQN